MVEHQDSHRYFLQWFVAQSLTTERNARQLHEKACNKYDVHYDADSFSAFISIINKNLKPIFMEIRHGKSEDDGTSYYALVNCSEDEHSKLATSFTANEIAFFKRVLESIVSSDDGYLPSMTLVNLGSELDVKISASASESLLTKLVEEKWLTEIDGDFSLGPRTLIELSMYLKNIYNEEIPDCKMCMHIVIKGQTCANCGVRIHLYCAARFFKGRDLDARKCPGCQANWLHEVPRIRNQRETTNTSTNSDPEPGSSGLIHEMQRAGRTRTKRTSR
ncbi:non-structural maintenance of chromosomes element 1 homolog [Rhopilema esculentum]|uniref:non-structural maintenance of chromosomes element 1 homolog n=1 Tax=Rhopilema esculentum TaxID=499914 RepID=UPI0031DF0221|eukprot:gene7760-13603_t